MKTIKKLNLHPGQEIGKVQQQFIMAGSGELVWEGNCFCSKKGHFHTMTASETFEYIEFPIVGVACYPIPPCFPDPYSPNWPYPFFCSGIVKTGTIVYSRKFKCIGINPLTHSAMPITSSVQY